MPQRRSPLPWLAAVGLVLLAACSGALHAHPDAGANRHRDARRRRPTPLPPDTLSVGVLGIGIGTFDLAAFPVARLKNEAKYHGAASVIVHFVTHRVGTHPRVLSTRWP